MPVLNVSKLVNLRESKIKHIASLEQRKISLMNRLQTIEDEVESIESQISVLSEEITSRFRFMIPNIEVVCLGLDERKQKIYGALITFPGTEIKIYKIISHLDIFFQNLHLNPVEFVSRIKEITKTWLLTEPDLTEYVDLNQDQKNVIRECIKNIERQEANFSRLPLNLGV